MKTFKPSFLSEQFSRRWEITQQGGLRARLCRWRVSHWMILQKVGIHCWARVPLFFGQKIWLLLGETTSSGLLAFGYSECALTALMLRLLKPGMRFVDVGAHLGYEAVLGSTLVGPAGKVISFEPQPQIVAWTRRNVQKFPHCRVVQSAVGDFCGELEFPEMGLADSAFSGQGAANSTTCRIKVPVTTLPEALRADERPVDFLKCDVEGAEMSVLRGAVDFLREDRPFLVLEGEMPNESGLRPRVQEFADFLAPLGYRGISFEFDGVLRTAPLGGLPVGHANVAFCHEDRVESLRELGLK
jgi:FkbM family methyltransferase